MTDVAWIGAAVIAARPQAIGALLRFFHSVDAAEEAFQEASLRALQHWPNNGPPRDVVAWLVFVGRNAALDGVRKRSRERPLPSEAELSDLDDAESAIAVQLDEATYRDDVLRLLFVCCHPDLPATQQIALALRIVSGLSVKEIARAFLVTEDAMEQRITRGKARIHESGIAFDAPSPAERAERLAAVATVIYLLFNEGYAASGGDAHVRSALCDEAVRLARILLSLYPGEPELLGLTALLLLQHSRTAARLDARGAIVLLEDQDRTAWDRKRIAEGLALLEKAERHRRPGPYQVQAGIAAVHARAKTPATTEWSRIEALYGVLETISPSPVITLNRAVAVGKVSGPAAALAVVEPLAKALSAYFYFHGVRGALLLQLGRAEEAREAFDRAIARANTAAEATHIREQIDRLTPRSAESPGCPR